MVLSRDERSNVNASNLRRGASPKEIGYYNGYRLYTSSALIALTRPTPYELVQIDPIIRWYQPSLRSEEMDYQREVAYCSMNVKANVTTAHNNKL